jgi:hypothetical protein
MGQAMTKKRAHNRKSGPREPNGRPSRRKGDTARRHEEAERLAFEDGPMQTVLRARRRHKAAFREPTDPDKYQRRDARPVSKQEMREQKLDARGSYLGTLWADGKITDQELAAGQDYCHRYREYAALNGLPAPTPKVGSYGEIRGGSRPDRIARARAARAQHETDQAILRSCAAGTRWAMRRACILDEPAPLRLVKTGLAELVKHGR